MTTIDMSRMVAHPMPTWPAGARELKPHYVGHFWRWDDGHHELTWKRVHLIEFLGDMHTAEDWPAVVMRVANYAEYLRDAGGLCAYCHGDPCAERSPAGSAIAVEYRLWKECTWNSKREGFTCPCCLGRPT